MNARCRWLFVVFLTLVCRPAFAAAPGAAALIAPSGEVVGTTLAFSWQAVPESTWYLFWLGKGTPTALVMQQWYTAEQAGCAGGAGTCTITITPPINAGTHTWFIQTWAAGLTGPWSAGMQFVLKDPVQNWSSKLPDPRRFSLVLGGVGVLDNETGLVWERLVDAAAMRWSFVEVHCSASNTGSRGGWRAPTVSELRSLMDPTRTSPALPAGHPFILPAGAIFYWTVTPYRPIANNYHSVRLDTGVPWALADAEGTNATTWCVRGLSSGGH